MSSYPFPTKLQKRGSALISTQTIKSSSELHWTFFLCETYWCKFKFFCLLLLVVIGCMASYLHTHGKIIQQLGSKCFHFSMNICFSLCVVFGIWNCAEKRLHKAFHTCYMGFKSGKYAGNPSSIFHQFFNSENSMWRGVIVHKNVVCNQRYENSETRQWIYKIWGIDEREEKTLVNNTELQQQFSVEISEFSSFFHHNNFLGSLISLFY